MDKLEETKGLSQILVDEDADYHQQCQALANYETAIKGAMLNCKVVMGDLYKWYKAQKPSLHQFCNDTRIDLPALIYALQRHPEAITRVNGIYLLSKSPKSDRGVTSVGCLARKRAMFDLGNELEIIVREKQADSFDIVSCAIMYGIEAKKIREKLEGENLLLDDIAHLNEKAEVEKNQVIARLANTLGVEFKDINKYNSLLNNRLYSLLGNIVKHEPEKMVLRFDEEFLKSNYPANAKAWRRSIEDQFQEYKGRPLVIISSDTHSVVNCLTGFAEKNQDEINQMAMQHPRLEKLTGTDHGLLYYRLQQLCKTPAGKKLLQAKIQYEESLGIKFIRDMHNTGIDVQIIDVKKMFERNSYNIDPRINVNREFVKQNGPVILNMDYSFGKQGRHSMQELCHTFGEQIQGIALIGKAGILCENGRKFDIMLPTHVQNQIRGGIYLLPNGNKLVPSDFTGFAGRIHAAGPMLTVPGTVMQNELVSIHYRDKARVIGVEMEAAHYLDSIEKAHAYGILKKDLGMYVGYWASDVPLNPDESLAEEHMGMGYIPLYSLICATLNKTLR